MPRSWNARHAAALACRACFLFAALAVIALHVLRPDLAPASRFMSEYALGPWGALMKSVFLVVALGSWAFAALVVTTVRASWAGRASAALVTAWGAGMGLLAVFAAGPSHDRILLAAEGALVLGILAFLTATRHRARAWRRFTAFSLGAGAVGAVAYALVDARGAAEWMGLSQRVYGVLMVAWFLVAAGYATALDARA